MYFDSAVKINKILASWNPNRHQKQTNRDNQRLMLEYLDKCIKEDLSNLDYRNKREFKSLYVDKVSTHLGHLGFKMGGYWMLFLLVGLFLDSFLIFIGLAKYYYYYYIPIFFIWITYKQIKGLRKAKREDKLLRW